MDERQAFAAIRNTIHLESVSKKTATKITRQLREVFGGLREQIEGLPAGEIERELRYRQLVQQYQQVFDGVSANASGTLTTALREEVQEQAEWAEDFLAKGTTKPLGVAVQGSKSAATARGVITQTQLFALADDTEVLGKRLNTLFGWEQNGSPFTKSMLQKVDRVVKQGFLTGQTNEEIARGLAVATNGAVREMRAIARTAVMDMSQRAHERMWDANDDVIVAWEFDASLDTRVCELCYPNDGQRREKRDDLPGVPVHPNCRCRVLPLTETDLELEKDELKEGQVMSIEELYEREDQIPKDARVYKTKVTKDGKTYFRAVRDVKLKAGTRQTMGEYLGKTSPEGRRAVLGEARAREFERLTTKQDGPKLDVNEALRRVTKGDLLPTGKQYALSAPIKPKKKAAPAPKAQPLKAKLAESKAKTAAAKKVVEETKQKVEDTKQKLDLTAQIAAKQKEYNALNADLLTASAKESKALVAKTKEVKAELDALKAKDPTFAAKAKALAEQKAAEEKALKILDDLEKDEKLKVPADIKAAKPPRAALEDYTGESYREIRAEEFRAAQKAGVKLSAYEKSQVEIHGPDATWKRKAKAIEDFLGRAPKYKGDIYRSLDMNKATMEQMISGLQSGNQTLAMESWTSNDGLNFAGQGKNQHVILRVKNKYGVDVRSLSANPHEDEVLMPKGVRYRVKGVTQQTISKAATRDGRYAWVVDLEQL